jgi:hypothetical protein
MKRYVAADHTVIVINGRRSRTLRPRLDLANHSPTGFSWGYGGSGPAQLALALLADHFGPHNKDEARRRYQDFKFAAIARLPQNDPWCLTSKDIDNILAIMDDPDRASGLATLIGTALSRPHKLPTPAQSRCLEHLRHAALNQDGAGKPMATRPSGVRPSVWKHCLDHRWVVQQTDERTGCSGFILSPLGEAALAEMAEG